MEKNNKKSINAKSTNRKRIALIILVLVILFLLLKSCGQNEAEGMSTVSITVLENPIQVLSTDGSEERTEVMLNNIVLTIFDSVIVLDPANAVLEDGVIRYVDEDLFVTMTNALEGGESLVTVTYQESSATATFTVVVVDEEDVVVTPGPATRPATRPAASTLELSVRIANAQVSSFDSDATRAKALLSNLRVVANGTPLVIDSSKGSMSGGQVNYSEDGLSITITNARVGGASTVTATYQSTTANASFTITVVAPEDGKKGNLIDAPAQVAPERQIEIRKEETPEVKNSSEEVASSSDSVVVNPVDVSTPSNPAPVQTVVPTTIYNNVAILYANKDRLSLFKSGEGAKLVIVYQNGKYINFASKQTVEFTVSEQSATTALFSFTEFDASGNTVAQGSGSYSK